MLKINIDASTNANSLPYIDVIVKVYLYNETVLFYIPNHRDKTITPRDPPSLPHNTLKY